MQYFALCIYSLVLYALDLYVIENKKTDSPCLVLKFFEVDLGFKPKIVMETTPVKAITPIMEKKQAYQN